MLDAIIKNAEPYDREQRERAIWEERWQKAERRPDRVTVETLDDLFSDDSMPQTAVDEELFELCTEFENAFHQCIHVKWCLCG